MKINKTFLEHADDRLVLNKSILTAKIR